MPFTTREIVKKHILDHHIGSSGTENERIQLIGTDNVGLSGRMIVSGSEKIKGKEQSEPFRENVSFSGSDGYNLSHSELIPDSVAAASDSSLSVIYTENIDYHIDYDSGEIRRIPSGSIESGAGITVWYLYFRLYQRGVDYDMDYQRGTIRRRSSGSIESGQWLFADYIVEHGGLDDDTIDNAISEANDQILAFIDESYHDSNDKSLTAAETYLAVSILGRIKGMEALSPSAGSSGNVDARSWAAVSDMYKKEAYNLMSRFAAPSGKLKSPSKA